MIHFSTLILYIHITVKRAMHKIPDSLVRGSLISFASIINLRILLLSFKSNGPTYLPIDESKYLCRKQSIIYV